MNFKDYRHKTKVRAAEITEEKMILTSALDQDRNLTVAKGDYAELRDGVLFGWAKADFDQRFEPRRAERQSKATRKHRKAKAAETAS